MKQPFYGKFRGIVTDIQDPLFMGRIRAQVPDVLGDQESGWAMACTPFAGQRSGFYALPTKGAGVWIEFEHGDPDYPIWSGCWWGQASDLPPEALVPPFQKIVIKSAGGNSLILDDTPGLSNILLRTTGGQTISMTPEGILVDNGQGAVIVLVGNQVVVNNGALQVI